MVKVPLTVPALPLNLDTVWLCVGDERIPFKLGGDAVQESYQAPADEQLAIEAQMKQTILDYMHGDLTADALTERIAALYAQAAQHGRELALAQVKEKK